MSKFRVEFTDKQISAISSMVTAAVIEDYDKLKEFKDTYASIIEAILSAEKISDKYVIKRQIEKEESVVTGDMLADNNETAEDRVEQDDSEAVIAPVENNFLPEEFFSTYNSAVEQHNTGAIINNGDECLRYGFGKQGQVAIQFWAKYPGEIKNPDFEFYINNRDAVQVSNCISEIVEVLFSNNDKYKDRENAIKRKLLPYCKRIVCDKFETKIFIESFRKSPFQLGERGYEISIDTHALNGTSVLNLSAIMTLTKKDGNDISIPFLTKQQIILFDEFLKHHLGE